MYSLSPLLRTFHGGLLPLCILSLVLCTSCADTLSSAPRLTVSISPLRYFVEGIGGDAFEVATLVPAGASPETYELTPQQVVEVSDSRAYFSIGTLGFEKTRLRRLTDNNPELYIVNVSDSIPLLAMEHDHDHGSGEDHDHSDGIDLHVWTSTSSARAIALRVRDALCTLDTARADEFRHRCDSLLTRIDSLDARIRQRLTGLRHRTFLIYHPALAYFARDYGLRQLAVEQDGKEPSAERMQQLIHLARTEGVKVVFIQEEHAGRAARRVAEAVGGRVVRIAPLSHDWEGEMLRIAEALAAAEH